MINFKLERHDIKAGEPSDYVFRFKNASIQNATITEVLLWEILQELKRIRKIK